MAELEPCQCGKRANMRLSDTNELRIFWVKCDCGMRTDYFPTAGLAAKCWNTRNDEAARQEEREACIQMMRDLRMNMYDIEMFAEAIRKRGEK